MSQYGMQHDKAEHSLDFPVSPDPSWHGDSVADTMMEVTYLADGSTIAWSGPQFPSRCMWEAVAPIFPDIIIHT